MAGALAAGGFLFTTVGPEDVFASLSVFLSKVATVTFGACRLYGPQSAPADQGKRRKSTFPHRRRHGTFSKYLGPGPHHSRREQDPQRIKLRGS